MQLHIGMAERGEEIVAPSASKAFVWKLKQSVLCGKGLACETASAIVDFAICDLRPVNVVDSVGFPSPPERTRFTAPSETSTYQQENLVTGYKSDFQYKKVRPVVHSSSPFQ